MQEKAKNSSIKPEHVAGILTVALTPIVGGAFIALSKTGFFEINPLLRDNIFDMDASRLSFVDWEALQNIGITLTEEGEFVVNEAVLSQAYALDPRETYRMLNDLLYEARNELSIIESKALRAGIDFNAIFRQFTSSTQFTEFTREISSPLSFTGNGDVDSVTALLEGDFADVVETIAYANSHEYNQVQGEMAMKASAVALGMILFALLFSYTVFRVLSRRQAGIEREKVRVANEMKNAAQLAALAQATGKLQDSSQSDNDHTNRGANSEDDKLYRQN